MSFFDGLQNLFSPATGTAINAGLQQSSQSAAIQEQLRNAAIKKFLGIDNAAQQGNTNPIMAMLIRAAQGNQGNANPALAGLAGQSQGNNRQTALFAFMQQQQNAARQRAAQAQQAQQRQAQPRQRGGDGRLSAAQRSGILWRSSYLRACSGGMLSNRKDNRPRPSGGLTYRRALPV